MCHKKETRVPGGFSHKGFVRNLETETCHEAKIILSHGGVRVTHTASLWVVNWKLKQKVVACNFGT